MAELRCESYKKRNHAPNECREAMSRDITPQVADSRTRNNKKKPANSHPKDAYSHPTSINGNVDTRRKPVKKTTRAKKV
jgi:hypothetical protein